MLRSWSYLQLHVGKIEYSSLKCILLKYLAQQGLPTLSLSPGNGVRGFSRRISDVSSTLFFHLWVEELLCVKFLPLFDQKGSQNSELNLELQEW